MWTRAELKDRAKQDMKPFYWYGVLVCFIAGILGAGSSGRRRQYQRRQPVEPEFLLGQRRMG